MPSPFPGMDPYLESPDWFPDLHDSLITFIKGAVQQRLPEFYYAQSSQRDWLECSQPYVEPDVEVVRSQEPRRRGSGRAVVAVAPSLGCNRASAKSFSPFPRVFARDLARVGHLGRRAA